MKNKMFLHILLIMAIFNICVPQKVFAYLDPGTGSMIFQIIIATIIAAGVTFKGWLYRIKNLFKCNHKTNDD